MKEIVLSIIVLTYNHEKYIKQAIDSINQQEIDFEYEVLIGEDASIDNTAKILKEYEKNAPPNYVFYYRTKNIGMIKNMLDLVHRSKGKYLIFLEGDDYWIYKKKLKKQIQFLENNMDYVATAHDVYIVDENSNVQNKKYIGRSKKRNYDLNEYKRGRLPGQTNTILMRNFFRGEKKWDSLYVETYPGDKVTVFILLSLGKINCSAEKWSAYRFVPKNGFSYSANNCETKDALKLNIIYHRNIYEYAKNVIRTPKCIETTEELYMDCLWRDFIKKRRSIPDINFKSELKKCIYIRKDIQWIVYSTLSFPLKLIQIIMWKR